MNLTIKRGDTPEGNRMNLTLNIPGLRIVPEMNRREHWAVRQRRFKDHKVTIWAQWNRLEHWLRTAARYAAWDASQFSVTLIRIGGRTMDSDNLASGFKAIRDQIADCLKIDDGDMRCEWRYAQEKGPVGVRIEIAIPDEKEATA